MPLKSINQLPYNTLYLLMIFVIYKKRKFFCATKNQIIELISFTAMSTGAIEYTDYITTEE